MMPVLFGLLGAILASLYAPIGVALLGILLGLVWKRLGQIGDQQAALGGEYTELRARYEALQNELRALRRGTDSAAAEPPPAGAPREAPAVARETPAPGRAPSAQPPPLTRTPAIAPPPPPGAPVPAGSQVVPSPSLVPAWLLEFFTTGNVVAKIGMVIVFFGVAFLVRYAADRGLLPIEYRLMATAAGAIVLLGAGWWLRRKQPEYAVVLQGGAVGLLYLTIFAAFRLYELLPATLTFALLLVVVVVSGVLAVLQNAMSLAALGTSGGFLAPILASTGGGSHVALFSYYAVLNGGVLGIAWFRAWRFLNWLAFVFTFGIGLVWGERFYRPELFATTEPFLVGFFLLFVAIAVLFAHRQPPQLRGYVDGTLVFGAPAVAFGMQSVLVADISFGRAYSAVALGALYLGLARWLWRRGQALRPLAEAFLAVAAAFVIVAVPLAFDGHATAAAWALEGAGLVWIGIRQDRMLARLTGCGLLLVAGLAFGVMAGPPPGELPVLNTRFLGCAAIAAGSLIAGRLMSKARVALTAPEGAFEWVLLVWGLLWWFGAVLPEVDRHVRVPLELSAMLAVASVSLAAIGFLARRLNWRAMMLATMPIGPLLWITIIPAYAMSGNTGPLANLGWMAWPTVAAVSFLVVFWFETEWPSTVVAAWHSGTTWFATFLVAWTAAAAVLQAVPETGTWSATMWCIVPALVVLALRRAETFPGTWPVRRFPSLYAGHIAGVLVAGILLWVAWACMRTGAAAPLPYVPLLNPLELTQGLGLVAAFTWWTRFRVDAQGDGPVETLFRPVVAALAFVALNAVVARLVHFYMGVSFDLDALTNSYVFQAGMSILWGVTAGVLMTVARLRLDRAVWMTGAGLLAVLIVKLFLVDLGNVGGIARIVSFLATGILILLIGYFAPAPPRAEGAT